MGRSRLNACAREDLANQSRYNLFLEIGAFIHGKDRGRASEFALNVMADAAQTSAPSAAATWSDPQLLLALQIVRYNCFP